MCRRTCAYPGILWRLPDQCRELATKSKLVALSVVDFRVAKESGLVFDLRTVANDHDLHIRGVEISSRGGHELGRSNRADVVPISFQIIRGKLVQLDG